MNAESTHANTPIPQDRAAADGQLSPTSDLVEYFRQYARERPEVVALWCFGMGFVLGWKMKMW